MTQKKSLYDFLAEAELSQYHQQFLDELKVKTVAQIKYVTDYDLLEIGMTKPEVRRLNKFFKKHCHQGALNKLKEILIRGQEELNASITRSTGTKSQVPAFAETANQLIDGTNVTLHKALGDGEFGSVHQAVWKSDSGVKGHVAVKTINKSELRHSLSQFLEIISEVQKVRHDNVLRLFGIVLNDDSIMTVMELAPMKSLFTILCSQLSRINCPVITLCNYAHQVASGMEFLEKTNVIHRDLCSRNILVFQENTVKVSDAGLTRALGVGEDYYQRNVSFNLKLPMAWCAPETIERNVFSSASDVWAYGVTLWEMFSYGFQPWAGFTGKQIASAISPAEGSQRLDQPDSCPSNFYRLLHNCWQHRPEGRPKFSEIVSLVKEMKPMRLEVFEKQTSVRSDCLSCKQDDIVTVLDNKPKNPPVDGMWKGVMESTGRVGFFDPASAAPFVEPKSSEVVPKSKLIRRHSSRRSLRSERRLHSGLIGIPQKDLRHVGHVGYDGAVFGDVSFIGQNYNRLPFKVRTPERTDTDVHLLMRSLTMSDQIPADRSFLSLKSDISPGTSLEVSPGTSYSMSPETSVFMSPGNGSVFTPEKSTEVRFFDFSPQPKSDSVESFDLEKTDQDTGFDDFNIPDFSGSIGFDLNIMDEMMKSFGKFDEDPIENQTPISARAHRSETVASGGTHISGKDTGASVDVAASGGIHPAMHSGNWRDKPSTVKVVKETNISSTKENLKLPTARVSTSRIPDEKFDLPICSGSITQSEEASSLNQRQRGLRFQLSEPGFSATNLNIGDGNRVDIASGGGGVLSKIGSVLYKRGENGAKRSLQNQVPSSSSSSAEFLPGTTERLPGHGQKAMSTSLPRDGSLRSGGSSSGGGGGGLFNVKRPVTFLREGRSFSRTKAKIKSSVSSVISSRGSTKKEPATNINVNFQFFDRLREQEQEKVKQEEESVVNEREKSRVCGSGTRDPPPPSRDQAGSRDYITRPLGLRSRYFDSMSDTQTDEGIQFSRFLPNTPIDLASGCDRLLVDTHDSSHDSEQSSMTHPSDDGIFADDSELDSPDIRVSPRVESSPAFCRFSQANGGMGVVRPVMHDPVTKRTDVELSNGLGCRYDVDSTAMLSCGELDFYELEMESVLDCCDRSSYLEENSTEEIRLDADKQLHNNIPYKHMLLENHVQAFPDYGGQTVRGKQDTDDTGSTRKIPEPLVLCDRDADDTVSSEYLKIDPENPDSPEYVFV